MSDRFPRMTVALGVFALVALLATVPAHASNMGFKLERDLQYQTGYGNIFYFSFPFYRSFPEWDGVAGISSDDVLLDFWLHSHDGSGIGPDMLGSMIIETFDNDPTDVVTADNSFYFRQVIGTGPNPTDYFIAGNVNDPFLVDDSAANGPPGWRGYRIVTGDTGVPGQTLSHNVVVVGSHNPSIQFAPLKLVPNFLQIYFVSIPYHTTIDTSDVALCNLWSTTFGGTCDGTTDTDPNAADPTDPSASVLIQCFDNTPGGTVNADNSFYFRQIVSLGPGAGTFIAGNITGSYPINPGEGYEFQLQGDPTLIPNGEYRLGMPHY